MSHLVYLVPLFPLIGFLINGLGRKVLPKPVSGAVGSLAVLASFVVSLLIFNEVRQDGFTPVVVQLFSFINAGSLHIPFAFQVDQLSTLFLLVITGVGFLIHLYSTSYMHDEQGPDFARYFAYLNLFIFSMLLLVLGSNYVIMFIGWEGVGLCSYLLIGYWFKNTDYGYAARKAFVMNRIGDLAFLIGIFWIIAQFGSVTYTEVFAKTPGASTAAITAITLLLFVGATGKSAQIPLYTWLPDAMAGPTPVSALIHAATMVTAGIYMIARSNVLYNLAPATQGVILVIGIATALLAASIALKQNDIKKVLAYSTVSQLGFMFIALGVGAYTTAIFHVMTHAFFKALLFLGSGSVIHAMGGEQDIRKMGGLGKKMRVTQVTFLIGCLAISGIPFFSGFFSKDEILSAALASGTLYYVLGVVAAMMTAFYMFRLYALTFSGTFRGTQDQEHHLHESPAAMTIPLIVLAILAVVAGYIGLPKVISEHHVLGAYLSKVVMNSNLELSHSMEWMAMGISTVAAIVMSIAGYMMNRKPVLEPSKGLGKVLENKWYVDELYDTVIVKPIQAFAGFLNNVVERLGIDGAVNGVGKLVKYSSRQLRLLQSGQVGTYILLMVIGMVILFLVQLFLKF